MDLVAANVSVGARSKLTKSDQLPRWERRTDGGRTREISKERRTAEQGQEADRQVGRHTGIGSDDRCISNLVNQFRSGKVFLSENSSSAYLMMYNVLR